MARFLYTADLHLTSMPDDEYRWAVFPWLKSFAANEELDALFILGDLTDRKDEHPAKLVLRLCDALAELVEFCPVYLLKGNHDYIDASTPFFRFLDRHTGVRFFSEPAAFTLAGLRFKVLPHMRKWRLFYNRLHLNLYDRVLFHQCLDGAVGDNGHRMQGVSPSRFDSLPRESICVGGDIHRPQRVGRARYVGSPHPIRFGDDFQPGALLERDGKVKFMPRVTIRKATLTLSDPEQLAETDLTEGDWVRVTLNLPRSEFVHWQEHRARLREVAQSLGLRLHGVKLSERPRRARLRGEDEPEVLSEDPKQVFDRFTAARGIEPSLAEAGRALLE